MYSSRVHVRVSSLLLTPHSPLPPEAKLLQVTISVTELTVVPHLSLGGGGLACGRGGAAPFFWATWAVATGSVSRGFLSSLGFGTQTYFCGGAFGGSLSTPSAGSTSEGCVLVLAVFRALGAPAALPILPYNLSKSDIVYV